MRTNSIAYSQLSKVIVPDYKLNNGDYVYSLEKSKKILKLSIEISEQKKAYKNVKKRLEIFTKLVNVKDLTITSLNNQLVILEKKEEEFKDQINLKDNEIDLRNIEIKGLKKQKTGLIVGGVTVVVGITLVAILTNVKL